MDPSRLETLDEIAIRHQTDRASVFTRIASKAHGYARHYDLNFKQLRDKPVKMAEIGVGGGEGIKMWLDYFQNGRVFGVDSRRDTNPWDTVGAQTHPRYTFNCGDQSSETFWACWLADHGMDWDIIIDDGGHFNDQIITTFNALWTAVKPGGFYCIEDLGCAYGEGSIFVKPNVPHHMQWLLNRIDVMNTCNFLTIDAIYFGPELAIIRKAF